jgi:hypothetical protein
MRKPPHLESIVSERCLTDPPSALPPNIHDRARTPSLLRIPELHAANSATVTGKVNHPGLALIGDSIPNLKLVVLTVIEVDNNSLELDVPTPDPKLNLAERSAVAHENPIVILPSVDSCATEQFPSALVAAPLVVATLLRGRGNAQTEQQQQQTAYTNRSLEVHAFLLTIDLSWAPTWR